MPRFGEIVPAAIAPALDELLAESRARIVALEECAGEADWDGFAGPLQDLAERLERFWAPVSHLNAVCDSAALRQAYADCLPKLTAYHAELGQNRLLFEGYRRLADSRAFAQISPARRKVVTNALRDFRLAGVELEGQARERFREIATELATLANRFEQNLLDATDHWHLDLYDAADLAGLPATALALARQSAASAGQSGWRFTLQAPSYLPFMMFSDRRELRQQMYEAFVTRASDTGPDGGRWDNGELMVQILALRSELAQLLGFGSFADYALADRMASSVAEVNGFLDDLVGRTRALAQRELDELRDYVFNIHGLTALEAWDIPYYAEKLKQSRYAFNDEDVRPYFPLPRVLEGLFDVARRLFGVTVKSATVEQVWHPDVSFFHILDADGELRGRFFLDLYAREHKRGGAWMADCIGRCRTGLGALQVPAAFLTCNFPPPVDGEPSLLAHDDVVALFHEFGHGLHHLLTQVDEAAVAGINGVPWDAVELPSQFLENWCWEGAALAGIAGHYQTGEPLPAKLLGRMRGARNFQSALQMVRQLEFSVFDLGLHGHEAPATVAAIQQVLNQVRARVAVIEPPAYNRFQNSFSHIFAGGYAAGYYSYKWAEVLSADAFGRFQEEGIFNAACGADFLHLILEAGGINEPLENFVAFRGREPAVDALLHQADLDR